MTPENHQKLERLLHETLRGLPPRKAPGSLESRVHAEIARRAALPWWRKNFRHWPIVAQTGFLLASAVLANLVFSATTWATSSSNTAELKTSLASRWEVLQSLAALCTALIELAGTLVRSIPLAWVYGGAAFVVVMYLALFGLGAAAYRTLYVPAQPAR